METSAVGGPEPNPMHTGYLRTVEPCPTCGHCPTCGQYKPQINYHIPPIQWQYGWEPWVVPPMGGGNTCASDPVDEFRAKVYGDWRFDDCGGAWHHKSGGKVVGGDSPADEPKTAADCADKFGNTMNYGGESPQGG